MSLSRERQVKLETTAGGGTTGTLCAIANYGTSNTAVIVTHPWGPLGGNMHNNVVVAAVLYFGRMGLTTCRFDLLPHSWISPGHAQVQQVQQIAHFLLNGSPALDRCFFGSSSTSHRSTSRSSQEHQQQHPQHTAAAITTSSLDDQEEEEDVTCIRPKQLILVGYSYGSLITGSVSADIPECVATISIAPPFGVQMWLLSFQSKSFLEKAAARNDLYRLFVMGDTDNFTSQACFRQAITTAGGGSTTTTTTPQYTEAAILKGADHFFRQREKDLMTIIGQWLKRTFPQCRGDLQRLPHLTLPHAGGATTRTAIGLSSTNNANSNTRTGIP